MTAKPKKIGGWLVLFCLGTVLFSPLMFLKEAVESKDLVTQFFDGLLICASLSAGIAVGIVSRRAKLLVRIYFGLLVIMVALMLVAVATESKVETGDVVTVIRTAGYVIIWWLYFRISTRVKETFGENW